MYKAIAIPARLLKSELTAAEADELAVNYGQQPLTDAEVQEVQAREQQAQADAAAALPGLLKDAAKDYRDAQLDAGFEQNGVRIYTDQGSLVNLLGAVVSAQGDSAFTLAWVVGGVPVQLDAATVIALGNYARAYVQQQYSAYAAACAAVDAGTATDEDAAVAAYDAYVTANPVAA